ncbi:MAG: hypothetical protein PF517_15160 [Salinivirgaceae bacterium]|jgi:tetratricopeptide (TPR) repeat protein|nr:hypothetical protein [Salinivirgaceae bacterium]
MSRNIIPILCIAFLTITGQAVKGQNIELLDSAAIHYSNNDFEEAIKIYEQIIENGYESSELYFNLGNAYYKSNKVPYAILNYERAKNLNSNDEDIEFNLNLANTHTVDKIEVIPQFFLSSWWDKLVQMLSTNQWAMISMMTFVIGLIAFVIFFMSRLTLIRQFSFWFGILFLVSSIFAFSFSRKQYLLSENEPDAIILTPSVVVKSSPSEGGTDLFLIHEGLKVTVTDKLGEWREIKLSDGNEGWIKELDMTII